MIANIVEAYNYNPLLFWALTISFWLIMCIIYYSRVAKRKLKWQRLADFRDRKASLSFVTLYGIEGIETFKPNYQIRIELLNDEIRFSEFEIGTYSSNLNSASLMYSQILKAEIVRMSENYIGRTNPKMPSSETIQTGITSYCRITYLNKDGEEAYLRFRNAFQRGNFKLFIQALQSRIAPPTPTDINL